MKKDVLHFGVFGKDHTGFDDRPTTGYTSWAEGFMLLARLQCVGEVMKTLGGVADECVEYPKAPPGTNTCSTTPYEMGDDTVQLHIEYRDLKFGNGDASFLLRDLMACK